MSKKAVIATGGKQYIVEEGDTLEVELLKNAKDKINFEPLMVIDGENISIGTPIIKDAKVEAKIIETLVKTDKVMSIRYKAKKRVKTINGHRQQKTVIKISSIS